MKKGRRARIFILYLKLVPQFHSSSLFYSTTTMLSLLCIAGFSLLTSLTATSPLQRRQNAYPQPEPCTGNCSAVHDPSVTKRATDGKYFRLSTDGNVAIASAPSLNGPWQYEGPMLSDGTSMQVADGQLIWVHSRSQFPLTRLTGMYASRPMHSSRPTHITLTTRSPNWGYKIARLDLLALPA